MRRFYVVTVAVALFLIGQSPFYAATRQGNTDDLNTKMWLNK